MSFPFGASTWRKKRGSKVISEPEFIGYYSVDADRNYLPDSSRLLYYNPPSEGNVYLDLNDGIESAIRGSGSSQEENYMFKWIKENHSKIKAPLESDRWINPNFVCSRKLLMTLLGTPVLSNEPWCICAAKWRGSIYLRIEKLKKTRDVSRDELTKFASWGFKFEQYILSDSPEKFPDTSKPVVETNEFRCLYQRRFGGQTVLFGVVMKGVNSKKQLTDPLPLNGLDFVDLKTSRIIENVKQKRQFRKYKLFKWWAQNFLTNTKNVLCGFKDDEGIVRNLKIFSLNDMIAMSERWDPTTCIGFCESLLAWISKTVVNDCNRTVYRFKREVYANCIKVVELAPSPNFTVIPTWFMKETTRGSQRN